MKQENTLDSVNICLNLALAEELLNLLCVKKYKLGIAESCTGGLLSYHFTALSGASSVLDGAMISYANEIKHSWLGVNKLDLDSYGAEVELV